MEPERISPLPRCRPFPKSLGAGPAWNDLRPPQVELTGALLEVIHAGVTIASTTHGIRVFEESNCPTYYFPTSDVKTGFLHAMHHTTRCEWKGLASYWTLNVRGREAEAAAWSYLNPNEGYEQLTAYLAFAAGRVDACYVGREKVVAQPSDCYGGWAMQKIDGRFKDPHGSTPW